MNLLNMLVRVIPAFLRPEHECCCEPWSGDPMNRRIGTAGLAWLLVALAGNRAQADEKPLIWQPIKNSETSYSVKLGMKLPTELEPQAGFDVGMDTTTGGHVVDTPVTFWSSIKTRDAKRPGYQMRRDLGFSMTAADNSAAITMNAYEKQIATPSLDLEREGAYALRYDGVQQSWTGIDVSQALKLRRSATGTALTASANGVNSFDSISAALGLEQQLGDHITLSGQVGRSFTSADNVATVNASYSYSW
jgi:hypothetical protein